MSDQNMESELNSNLINFLKSVETLLHDKDFENSLNLLKQAQEHFISDSVNDELKSTFMVLYGFTLLHLGYIDDAKESFEEALQFSPNSSEACRGLAETFFADDMIDEAKTMLEWSIKSNPDNFKSIDRLNEIEGSIESSNSIINKEQIFENGYNLFVNKQYAEVIELFYQAKNIHAKEMSNEENNEFTSAFFNLKGFSYLSMNLLEDAKNCFEYSLQINSRSSKACLGLGEVMFIRNEHESAKTMYEYAILNDSNNFIATECLAKVNKLLQFEENHNSLLLK